MLENSGSFSCRKSNFDQKRGVGFILLRVFDLHREKRHWKRNTRSTEIDCAPIRNKNH